LSASAANSSVENSMVALSLPVVLVIQHGDRAGGSACLDGWWLCECISWLLF
jgi:hypothetical protein